jgi:hypothetical protein
MADRVQILDTSTLNWNGSTQLAGDVEEKILRSDRSLLVRIPPGGEMLPHSHRAAIQHFVLEGAYETEGQTVSAGMYRMIPGGSDVAPIQSKDGVVFLMILDPIAA